MIRKPLLFLFIINLALNGFSEEAHNCRQIACSHDDDVGYASRNATVLSMMGWGIGLGIGIAILCALIPQDSGSSDGK